MTQPFTGLLEDYKPDVFDELSKGIFGTDSCISCILLFWWLWERNTEINRTVLHNFKATRENNGNPPVIVGKF